MHGISPVAGPTIAASMENNTAGALFIPAAAKKYRRPERAPQQAAGQVCRLLLC